MIILSFGCQSGSENDNHWGGEFSDLISAVDIFILSNHFRKWNIIL
jgi:hypothetical protein